MANDFSRVSLVSREPIRSPQRDEVLMPVQLPDQLMIADQSGVEVIDSAPVHRRRALGGERLQMPVDRLVAKSFVPEQIEPPATYRVRAGDNPLCFVRPTSTELADGGLTIVEAGDEGIR